MKTVELVSATGKKEDGTYKERKYNFNDPESIEEACTMWGTEKVLALAIAQAHTDSINAVRNELKGKEPGVLAMGRKVAAFAAKADPELLAKLEALLGEPLK